MIYTLANLLALVSQLLQPVDGHLFTDAAILSWELQRKQDDSVYMLTQLSWCNDTKILCSKVCANFVRDSLVIKQCVLAMFGPLIWGWKVLVLKKLSLVFLDLTCEVISVLFSHPSCHSETCFQAWCLATAMVAVLFSKTNILKDSGEMHCHLDAVRGRNALQFFNFL